MIPRWFDFSGGIWEYLISLSGTAEILFLSKLCHLTFHKTLWGFIMLAVSMQFASAFCRERFEIAEVCSFWHRCIKAGKRACVFECVKEKGTRRRKWEIYLTSQLFSIKKMYGM